MEKRTVRLSVDSKRGCGFPPPVIPPFHTSFTAGGAVL